MNPHLPSFTVIFPVYNGARFVERSMQALQEFMASHRVHFELIAVDDGSSDDSLQILQGLNYDNLKVLKHSTNKGKGAAVKTAVLTGKPETEWCVILDSDLPLEINLEQILIGLKASTFTDVMVMSRYHADSSVVRKWHRRLLSRAHRKIVDFFFPFLGTADPDVGFKMMRTEWLKQLCPHTNLNRWSWDLQFLVAAGDNGARIKDHPMDWQEQYESTTVNVLRDSIEEFLGILYVKFQSLRGLFELPQVIATAKEDSHAPRSTDETNSH